MVAMLFSVPTDVRDSLDPARDNRLLREDGDKDTLAIGTNTPYFDGHSKYLKING